VVPSYTRRTGNKTKIFLMFNVYVKSNYFFFKCLLIFVMSYFSVNWSWTNHYSRRRKNQVRYLGNKNVCIPETRGIIIYLKIHFCINVRKYKPADNTVCIFKDPKIQCCIIIRKYKPIDNTLLYFKKPFLSKNTNFVLIIQLYYY